MIYDNDKLNEIHDMTWPNWGKVYKESEDNEQCLSIKHLTAAA